MGLQQFVDNAQPSLYAKLCTARKADTQHRDSIPMIKSFSTLQDVADAVGMSRAQVARALRGDACVRPETRERIGAIAAQLNYRPNLAARSLAEARSSIVGLVIGDPNNPFHIQLAQAVDRELSAAGFDPVTSLRSFEDASALRESERLLRLRAAGVIMIATPHSTRTVTHIADQLPCVYIGSRTLVHPRVTAIAVDDEAGVRAAMQHLLSLGHTRIAHLGGGTEASARQRTKAYCTVMQEAGLPSVFLRGTHDAASGRRGVDQLFAAAQPPTAIFASNDFIAMGVMDRLKAMGLSVPDDVSVMGFDDIPEAANEVFSLSTIRQDTDQQAKAAVEALQVILAGKAKPVRRRTMPTQLILRRSCAAPKPA
jgi:DNA-binding LacI/PurR family transcriptional regulator